MSGLESELGAAIRRDGPLSVARFMSLALHHPTSGYYRNRDPLGPEGDFVTAPELSQAFGEVVGAWLAQAWLDLGRPAPFRLVELGPGRGTLLADALRATRAVDGFHDGLRLHLVETSARLRAVQAARLAEFDPSWHPRLGEVPSGPLLLIANEFFDALPVHQLVATARGWVERCVDLDPEGGSPSAWPNARRRSAPTSRMRRRARSWRSVRRGPSSPGRSAGASPRTAAWRS